MDKKIVRITERGHEKLKKVTERIQSKVSSRVSMGKVLEYAVQNLTADDLKEIQKKYGHIFYSYSSNHIGEANSQQITDTTNEQFPSDSAQL